MHAVESFVKASVLREVNYTVIVAVFIAVFVAVVVSFASNINTGSGSGGSGGPQTYTVTFDGMGVALTGGATRCVPIRGSSGSLTAVRIQACNGYSGGACNAAGSGTFDIQTATDASYASSGPSAAATIKSTGSLLSIASAYAADGVLTNWTTSGFAGKTACVVMTSPTAISLDVTMVVQ